jgi:hypothetical protein
MFEVGVIEEAGAAEVALDPIRTRLLALLVEPHSATSPPESAPHRGGNRKES